MDKPLAKVVRTETHVRARDPRRDVRWWTQENDAELAGLAFATFLSIREQQSTMRREWATYIDMYRDRRTSVPMPDGTTGTARRTAMNACHSASQTCIAQIAKNRPRPLFLSKKGDNAMQKKAMALTSYIDGLFRQMAIHTKGQTVFRDALLTGTGLAYFYADPDRGEICCERIPTGEIYVSDDDARYGKPRQMFRARQMSRDNLVGLYPEKAEDIYDLSSAAGADPDADLIDVLECWHLPTTRVRWVDDEGNEKPKRGKGLTPKTDGYHAIVAGTVVLSRRKWTHDWFPVPPMYWEEPIDGWFGRGLVEGIAGKQQELNDLSRDLSVAHRRMGRPVVFVPIGSKIDLDDINDEIGAIIHHEPGHPPQYAITPTLAPQIYMERDKLWAQMFEETGVSHANATGQKPAGVEAAVAIREVNDIAGTRFVIKAQAYEQWFMTAAAICIDLARELYDEHEVDLVVKGRAGKFIESVKWSDVDLEDDAYDVQLFPTSLLPSTPAGILQTVTELLQGQVITPEEGRRLMDFPDLDGARGMSPAVESFEYAVEVVGDLIDGGEYIPPDPRCDLASLQRTALANYMRCLRNKTSEATLEKLRQLMDDTQRFIDLIAQGMTPDALAAGKVAPDQPPVPPPGPGGPDMIPPGPGGPPGGGEMTPEMMAALAAGAPPGMAAE